MIELVDGAIYTVAEENFSHDMLEFLNTKEHENDVVCIIRKGGDCPGRTKYTLMQQM